MGDGCCKTNWKQEDFPKLADGYVLPSILSVPIGRNPGGEAIIPGGTRGHHKYTFHVGPFLFVIGEGGN